MSPIRLIVTDLDFSLLHSNQTISSYTKEVFQACADAGILTAFATARFIYGVQDFMEQVHPDYAVLNDGTMIYHRDQFLFGIPVPSEAVTQIIGHLKSQDPAVQISAAAQNIVYRNHNDGSFTNFTPHSAFRDFTQPFTESIYKLVSSPSEEIYCSSYGRLADACNCQTFQYRGENRHAFLSKEAGKFSGIKQLAEYLNIPLSQVAAFGDDKNDMEMIQKCGLGVAMKNALPEVQAVADAVTLTNDEDGVARYIEQYLLPR